VHCPREIDSSTVHSELGSSAFTEISSHLTCR